MGHLVSVLVLENLALRHSDGWLASSANDGHDGALRLR
jgi:hypothetical protein